MHGQQLQNFDAFFQGGDLIVFFFQRGYARLQIQDTENALLDFRHYLSIEKNNPEAFYQKGLLEYDNENFHIAIEDFTNTIILKPNHEFAYFKRGLAKQKIGDIIGCCKDFKTAFEKGNLEAYHYIKQYCENQNSIYCFC